MASRLELVFKIAVEEKKVPAIGAIALDASGQELFKAAFGTNNVGDETAAKFTTDTNLLLFSCTKLVTSVAALQLIEQGKLRLDDPVEKHVPLINKLKVLEGFGDDGQPILRDPKEKATVLNLFTHTTGLSYDFFDKDCLKWRMAVGQNPAEYVGVSGLNCYLSPLHFEAGANYRYGPNTDFLGWVVEAVSGMKLQDYFAKHIFEPLGLKNTGLERPSGRDYLVVHLKGEDGSLTGVPAIEFPANAEVVAGGHFLTSTLEEYAQFLLALLNNGTHPKTGVKIIDEKTAKNYLYKDFIPQICSDKDVGVIGASIAQLSNEGEFLPGVAKGWSCGLMMNNEDTPNGRPKGSGAWAGLGNLYYWLDPTNGKLGLIGTQMFPFLDSEVCHLFDELERFTYGKEPAKARNEKGSNYVVTKAIEVSA